MGKRRTLALAVLVAAVASYLGATITSDSTAASAKPVRLAFFNAVAANAYTASVYSAIKAEAKASGSSVTQFDAAFDQNKQISQMQDAIVSKKFDAFVVLPVNGAVLTAPTAAAGKAGIKVVSVFNNIGPDLDSITPQVPGVVSVVASRLSVNGTLLGNLIVSACAKKNPCNVAYMPGSFKQATEKIRLDALNKVVKKKSAIKMKASAEGGYLADPALKAATDLLQANPNIDVFATSGDQMMTGIIQAVKSAGLLGKVKLIGDGTTIEGVAWVRQGILFGDPVALPYTEGQQGARLAIKAARGEKVARSVNSIKLSPVGPIATKKTLSTKAGKAFKGQYHG
jgi:ribose transport system substrate-binding protein